MAKKTDIYPGYPEFPKGVIPEFEDCKLPTLAQKDKDLYHDIEALAIQWSNDGTKSAGILARRIIQHLKELGYV
jgi:hypothetical protein